MKFHIETWGCQMNDHDSEKLSGLLVAGGPRAGGLGRGCGPGAAQHLLHPGEGRAQGLFRAGATARGEGAAALADRRGGLPGPAGEGRASSSGRPRWISCWAPWPCSSCRGWWPRPRLAGTRVIDTEAIPGQSPVPAGGRPAPTHGQGPGDHHRGLRPRLHLLRGAHHARPRAAPALRGRPGGSARPRRSAASGRWSSWARTSTAMPGAAPSRSCWSGSAEIDGLEWIRFTTSHPMNFTRELARVLVTNPKVAPFLHLPIQSGSDRILRRMGRQYTAGDYLERVGYLGEGRRTDLPLHGLHRGLPRGDGRGLRGHDAHPGSGGLRCLLQLRLLAPSRNPGPALPGRSSLRAVKSERLGPAPGPTDGADPPEPPPHGGAHGQGPDREPCAHGKWPLAGPDRGVAERPSGRGPPVSACPSASWWQSGSPVRGPISCGRSWFREEWVILVPAFVLGNDHT